MSERYDYGPLRTRMVLMGPEDDVYCIRDVTEQMQALERLADDGI